MIEKNLDDKVNAQEWFERLAKHDGWIVFDTETTGLGSDAEIVQISIVDSVGEVLVNETIKPTQPIELSAAKIHGITNESVKDSMSFVDIYGRVAQAMHLKVVLAYNFDFDIKILQQTCRRYSLPEIRLGNSGCAMKVYAQYYGDWNSYHESYRWQKLGHACETEGVTIDGELHDAATDARLTVALIHKIGKQGN